MKLLDKESAVYRVAVGLFLLVASGYGVEVCEYEDANLLFPNTPISYAADIKAKTWNKDNGIRFAFWLASSNFKTIPPYTDRVMAIGENSIKIRNVTRNDTGLYTLVLTTGSMQNFTKFSVHLEVVVPPTDQCIPNITHEGNALSAILPPEGCGIPKLIPNWTSGNQKLISDRISVLNLTSEAKSGLYIACAVGNLKRCSQVDSSSLCKHYIVSEDNIRPGMILWWIIPVIIVIIGIIGAGALLIPIKRKNYSRGHRDNSWTENGVGSETIPLILSLECNHSITDAKRHLIDQYKRKTTVAISPCTEDNLVDVSQVFCELEIRSLGAGEDTLTGNVTSNNLLFSRNGKDNFRSTPVLIIGKCGSGKTTWCKNLVHQWCQHNDNDESKSDKDSNLPGITSFEILLYIELKEILIDSCFMEHIKHKLFDNAPHYYEDIMRYIKVHTESALLLIDGLDEVSCSLEPLVNLLKEEKRLSCSIVLTSRLSGLECLKEKAVISLRLFEIQGMNPDSTKEYARKVLNFLSKTSGEELNVDHFWKFANLIQVLTLCHIPLLCLSLLFIWIENRATSLDVSYAILMIVEHLLQRARNRECYKVNNDKVVEQQHVDISEFIPKLKHAQHLRDHGYLIKILSDVAHSIWCRQLDADVSKQNMVMETRTTYNRNDLTFCLETGILLKTIRNTSERTESQISFTHPLMLDLFVALSIALERGEPFKRHITTKMAVIENISMMHMLCQVAPMFRRELISCVSNIFKKSNEGNENNEKDEYNANDKKDNEKDEYNESYKYNENDAKVNEKDEKYECNREHETNNVKDEYNKKDECQMNISHNENDGYNVMDEKGKEEDGYNEKDKNRNETDGCNKRNEKLNEKDGYGYNDMDKNGKEKDGYNEMDEIEKEKDGYNEMDEKGKENIGYNEMDENGKENNGYDEMDEKGKEKESCNEMGKNGKEKDGFNEMEEKRNEKDGYNQREKKRNEKDEYNKKNEKDNEKDKYSTKSKSHNENDGYNKMNCKCDGKDGYKDMNEKGNETLETSELKLICNIKCNGVEPVKWITTFMYMDELSNAKLSILTEGLKYANDLTVLSLQLNENKNELLFRLPILLKLRKLKIEIEHCTLELDEEHELSKVKCSELETLIIKYVSMDLRTTERIVRSVLSCKRLRTLELCPQDESGILELSSIKTLCSWKYLAESIQDMTKLSKVRLYNLQIRENLPALLESLCRCPTIEMLDLKNLCETGTKEALSLYDKNKYSSSSKACESKRSEKTKIPKRVRSQTHKVLQLTNNVMSEKSWQALSAHLEYMSPVNLHIEKIHQSSSVLKDVLCGISKCKDLKVLAICNIQAGHHPVSFFYFKHLHNLRKFTLSNITMPDSSWKELSDILERLENLEELSFTHLEKINCFIEINKLLRLKFIEIMDVHFEDVLWSTVLDKIMALPNLKTLELISCKMSDQAYLRFSVTVNQSSFHMETKKKVQIAETKMVSLDVIVRQKENKFQG